jgi:hypothetical protein
MIMLENQFTIVDMAWLNVLRCNVAVGITSYEEFSS